MFFHFFNMLLINDVQLLIIGIVNSLSLVWIDFEESYIVTKGISRCHVYS